MTSSCKLVERRSELSSNELQLNQLLHLSLGLLLNKLHDLKDKSLIHTIAVELELGKNRVQTVPTFERRHLDSGMTSTAANETSCFINVEVQDLVR